MIKAIRLKIFQQMPNFRKPASFLIRESFPLPPYSTVIGMIHRLCGYEEYHDMRLSIQGTSASDASDLAVMYSFGIKYDATRHQLKCDDGKGGFAGINRGVRPCHLLTDLNMMIHILPSDDDFEHIMKSLMNPPVYPSLGRHEDIARIDEVTEAEIMKYDPDDDDFYYLKHNAYIPLSDIEEMPGKATVYRLTKKFSIDPKTGLRGWDEIVKAAYLPYSESYESKECLYDAELKAPVAFA